MNQPYTYAKLWQDECELDVSIACSHEWLPLTRLPGNRKLRASKSQKPLSISKPDTSWEMRQTVEEALRKRARAAAS